ncbi:hypothetical protein ACJRO7_020550 [Eucalyptus globulus]|uniref:GRF-type domain-containing protein n=1 Tax=Eucalyptus globulus TaxID=34317 RepID=A0ABD3KHQ2_EUCGL
MSSSSVNTSTWSGLTFQNQKCKCDKLAAVKISESKRNKHKLYYTCEDQTCDFFSWCLPTSNVPHSIPKVSPAVFEDDVRNIKYLLEHLIDELKNTDEKAQRLRHNVQHLNVLLVRGIFLVCVLFVILLGLKKGIIADVCLLCPRKKGMFFPFSF